MFDSRGAYSVTWYACCRVVQLFGYDVMVDENLRPWLLEVNASPSLGASNKNDLRLKKQMVGHVFDIIDVEGRQALRITVGRHISRTYRCTVLRQRYVLHAFFSDAILQEKECWQAARHDLRYRQPQKK